MTYIYRNGELHAIVDDQNKAEEALAALRECYPQEKWTLDEAGTDYAEGIKK
mgnify:CR=1 FL=1